jgi:hypothetical protein
MEASGRHEKLQKSPHKNLRNFIFIRVVELAMQISEESKKFVGSNSFSP